MSENRVLGLLEDCSLEMTGKDVQALRTAAPSIPPGTRINVTYLGTEDLSTRVAAAAAVREAGFAPVPHLSARRIASQSALERFLRELGEVDAVDDVFVVGGDPVAPEGPFDDALAVIRSGLLAGHGVRAVGVGGYPDGHPHIAEGALWAALTEKVEAIEQQGLAGSIITQFGFDVAPVVRWIEELRVRGVGVPVRVGVPGPAGVRRLLAYAGRFGVASSAGIARKYGFSITNLLGTAGPDRFVEELATAIDPARHGVVRLHLYTFGGLGASARWMAATGDGGTP